MRSPHSGSTVRLGCSLFVVQLAFAVTFCAGRTPLKTTTQDPARVQLDQLWIQPNDLESRDLFYGSGGPQLGPDPLVSYELIAVDDSGYSPGYDVRDPQGTQWSVKLGIEAQPEVAVSRVLWAIGYHQPPTYLLTKWELLAPKGGRQDIARFRRESADERAMSDWSWYQNPFVTTQPFRGLVVANLVLNNWDWKTSNNKVYDVTAGDGGFRRYVVRDLGASLGKTTFPQFLKWTPLRGMGQGSRNDLKGFEEQGFIKEIEGSRVKFHYRGIHQRLVNLVTVDDVVWTCSLMARISDQQWQDVFRAAGYSGEYQQRYTAKLKSKIREGLALSRSQAHMSGLARSEPDSQIGHEREVVGRDQRAARARQFDVPHLYLGPLVVDVIQMQKREDPRVRAAPLQVREQIDAVEGLRQ